MRFHLRSFLTAVIAAAALGAAADVAAAQDYTVSSASGLFEEGPENAVPLQIHWVDSPTAIVDLPFGIQYYGRAYDTLTVYAHGFVKMGTQGTFPNQQNSNQPDNAGPQDGGEPADGIIAVLWDDLVSINLPDLSFGRIVTFTAGTAPERRFIVSWEGIEHRNQHIEDFYFQVQFHESDGRIVFAYPVLFIVCECSTG